MSIASEIADLEQNLEAAQQAIVEKGGTVSGGLAGLATDIEEIPCEAGDPDSEWGVLTYYNNSYKRFSVSSQYGVTFDESTADWSKFSTFCDLVGVNWGSQGMPDPSGRCSGYVNFQTNGQVNISSDNSLFVSRATFDSMSGLSVTGTGQIYLEVYPTIDKTSTATAVLSEADFNKCFRTDGNDIVFSFGTVNKDAIVRMVLGSECDLSSQNFLYYCTNLEYFSFGKAHPTSIGYQFLGECPALRSPIIMPDSVTTIGANFMTLQNTSWEYSDGWNNTLKLSENLTSVDIYFLYGQKWFNQPLELPNSLKTIAHHFMCECAAFNQPVKIPNNIQTIEGGFLTQTGLTSPVDVGYVSATVLTKNPLSTKTVMDHFGKAGSATMDGPATPIKGASRQLWLSRLPNGQIANQTYLYRKLEDGGE